MPGPEHHGLFQPLDDDAVRRQLRDSVAAVVREATRAAPAFDTQRWRQIAQLGWLGLQLPEAAGGVGLGPGELVALHQELARGALTEPVLPVAVLAARPIARAADAALPARLLPALLAGELLASLAWQDAAGSVAADAIGPRASPATAGGWTLAGTAAFVPLAPRADGLVVAARTHTGPLLCWVPRASGYTVAAAVLADGSDCATSVGLDGVAVPPADVLAHGPAAQQILAEVLDTAVLAASAELVGTMEQMLSITLAYLGQRLQFGQPLGSFQAPQHGAVNVYVQVELARAVLAAAARVFERGAPAQQRTAAAARAKARCSDAALFTVKRCIQLHGAIAYTQDYVLSRPARRAMALSALYGNAAAHRRRYAALALNEPGAPR
ncbi:acyl-CoA dehydrogenase family protein [Pseudorhodoferax sp.]|uniref:acyl-CoA dehydrogenase family protein n=1 Tax=Pseudorhodoferax sp. TaxID=1993553 RepID=UPI002DD67568|nr:acyl-CoA dehydrogenase family protein [Pseudorhodoferax sp.]